MNSFIALQKRAKRALDAYEKFRNELNVKDPMHYETIKRESQPFIKGYFTLAVLGEMSAGKSTLINALLGQRGLLPSSHGQTTCVLTEIVYSEKESVEVVYADTTTKVVKMCDLGGLVAIPSEYENLPVNEINRRIICGLSFDDIWHDKESLSKLQSGIPIDETLLKKYFESHSKSEIPVKVTVKYPLSEAFRGWRIVDTPGVGAIGGIERSTRNFINGKDKDNHYNVDAIIFVNSGRLQFQRNGFNSFVEDTFETIYDEARRRLFLVITCAADSNFIDHKEQELDRARKLFIEKYKVKEERLICVDSICSLFSEYVTNTNVDLMTLKKKDVPSDWLREDWETSINVRYAFEGMLRDNDREINNKNLLKCFNQYSGISELRKMLNDFAENEKMKVFNSLMKHINNDLTSLRNVLKQNQKRLDKKLKTTKENFSKQIKDERTRLEDLKIKKDSSLHILQEKYSRQKVHDRFHTIDEKVLQLRIEESVDAVKTKADGLLHAIDEEKGKIYSELSSDFESTFDNLQEQFAISFPPIDFDSLAKKAHDESFTLEPIAWEKKESPGVFAHIKRFIGNIFGNDSVGYENDYDNPKVYREVGVEGKNELTEFIGNVVKTFTEELISFINSISLKIDELGSEVSVKIDEKINNQQCELDKLLEEDDTSKIESECRTVFNKIEAIDVFIDELKSIRYGR